MTKSQCELYNELVKRANNRPKNERFGQALCNALYELRPDLWDLVTGTKADPFFDNERIAIFYQVIFESENKHGITR